MRRGLPVNTRGFAVRLVLFIEFCEGAGAKLVDGLDHIGYYRSPLGTFGCRDKGHTEAAVIKADTLQQALDHEHPLGCLVVALKIVAVTKVASRYEDTIGTVSECLQYEECIDTARAHNTDNPDVGGVLDTAATGKVSTGIGTPVADDTLNLGLPDAGAALGDGEISGCRHLLLTSEEECIDLGTDLRCREVLHPDGSAGAESSAGTTTLTLGFGDLHDLPAVLLNQCEC